MAPPIQKNQVRQYTRYPARVRRVVGRKDFQGPSGPARVYWAPGQDQLLAGTQYKFDFRGDLLQSWFALLQGGIEFARYNLAPTIFIPGFGPLFLGTPYGHPIGWPPPKQHLRLPRIVRFHFVSQFLDFQDIWKPFVASVKLQLEQFKDTFVFTTQDSIDLLRYRWLAACTPHKAEAETSFLGTNVLNIVIYDIHRAGWYWPNSIHGVLFEDERAKPGSAINQSYPTFIQFNRDSDIPLYKSAFQFYRGLKTWIFTDQAPVGPVGLGKVVQFEQPQDFPVVFLACFPELTFTGSTSLLTGNRITWSSGPMASIPHVQGYCTVMCTQTCDPGNGFDQTAEVTWFETFLDVRPQIVGDNLSGITQLATELTDWGLEYKGDFNRTSPNVAQMVAMIKTHFGLV